MGARFAPESNLNATLLSSRTAYFIRLFPPRKKVIFLHVSPNWFLRVTFQKIKIKKSHGVCLHAVLPVARAPPPLGRALPRPRRSQLCSLASA